MSTDPLHRSTERLVAKTMQPAAELGELIRLFYADAGELGMFGQCAGDDIPDDYRALLAHDAHMTVTVEERHRCAVNVEVLRSQESASHYVREILLRRSSDNRVVQYGIVRLKLNAIEAGARAEILAKQIPLGRVLINHNVLRQVQLLAVWKVICGPALAELLDASAGDVTYGRTALIHCNEEPAIELLEIVTPEAKFQS